MSVRGAALLVWLFAAPLFAQETETKGEIYDPPRTEAGEAYRKQAKAAGITVDARTLSKDAPLTLRPPRRAIDLGSGEGAFRVLGWLVLGGLVALLIVALLQAKFGDLFRRSEETVERKPQIVELADVGGADLSRTRLSDLAQMDDPREALRLLLLMVLTRAADANGIRLSRSLTAREVFRRVPASWRRRDVLEVMVRRAELVLFGGRPFERADLAPLVEAAGPLLRDKA